MSSLVSCVITNRTQKTMARRATSKEATADKDDFWSTAGDTVCYSRVTVPNPSEVHQRKPTDKDELGQLGGEQLWRLLER